MVYRVQRARPEDAAALTRLHAQAMPQGWTEADFAASCLDDCRIVLGAWSGSGLAGLIVLQTASDEGEILALAVEAEERRQGVASHLLKAAIELCQERRIASLYLEVAESNAPALRLYEKTGFKTAGRRAGYYRLARPAPESALIMRLDTGPALKQIER